VDELRQLVRALEEAAATIREREGRQQAAEQLLRAADAPGRVPGDARPRAAQPLASVANASHLLKLAPRRPDVIETVGAILARQVEQMTAWWTTCSRSAGSPAARSAGRAPRPGRWWRR
jgi:hypothetical protein